MEMFLLPPPPASPLSPHVEELPGYSVPLLVVAVVVPFVVLVVLSAVAILVFRRIHRNQMERLTSRDAEYGTIDGLIASNVGESTLAVSTRTPGNTAGRRKNVFYFN